MMGNINEGKGLFAPLVVVTRNIVGKKQFNQLRGKAIALHSQVIPLIPLSFFLSCCFSSLESRRRTCLTSQIAPINKLPGQYSLLDWEIFSESLDGDVVVVVVMVVVIVISADDVDDVGDTHFLRSCLSLSVLEHLLYVVPERITMVSALFLHDLLAGHHRILQIDRSRREAKARPDQAREEERREARVPGLIMEVRVPL
jgi:hypothetical protein